MKTTAANLQKGDYVLNCDLGQGEVINVGGVIDGQVFVTLLHVRGHETNGEIAAADIVEIRD